MQWILQKYEDTQKLADALEQLNIPYSWHKVVPFTGELLPEPQVNNPRAVVMFGFYTMWRYAKQKELSPGVFRIAPFVYEKPWQPFMLNGPNSKFLRVDEIEAGLPDDGQHWFIRPVSDSKEQAGKVRTSAEIRDTARKVTSINATEIPDGSLRSDTLMMLSPPVRILKEWRIWIVNDHVITYSLYNDGTQILYRPEIDQDALEFAQKLAGINKGYSPAYVMDICSTDKGFRLVETNCINAAGFYAADLVKLAKAIDGLT